MFLISIRTDMTPLLMADDRNTRDSCNSMWPTAWHALRTVYRLRSAELHGAFSFSNGDTCMGQLPSCVCASRREHQSISRIFVGWKGCVDFDATGAEITASDESRDLIWRTDCFRCVSWRCIRYFPGMSVGIIRQHYETHPLYLSVVCAD